MLTPLKTYGFPLLIIIAIGVFLFLNGETGLDKTVSKENQLKEVSGTAHDKDTAPAEEDAKAEIVVDVKGAVSEPGVYEVDSDARVNDVIKMAGGFTQEAEQATVNLAERVHDEMVVEVSTNSEDTAEPKSGNHEKDAQLRINEASQEEIEELNGIGPAKAEAIIEYRENEGYFKTADDILNVAGIGEKTLESLKDDIKIP